MWCVRCACELNYDEDDLCLNCEADEFYGVDEFTDDDEKPNYSASAPADAVTDQGET